MTPTRPDIDSIKARCEAASDGPGYINFCPVNAETLPKIKTALISSVDTSIEHGGDHDFHWITQGDELVVGYFGNGPTSFANATLWANAKTDIPALIAYIAELESKIATDDLDTPEEICRRCDGNGYVNPPEWTVRCQACKGRGLK